MALYGIPYMGSKTKIAETIHSKLPDGERFVDLFGGGFAMTHCAILSGKYKRFLYNDFNPEIVQLVKDACAGKYNYKIFKPEFITREMYNALKDKDPYIKYIWSFGNSGKGYLFGKDIEPIKHAAHDFVVFGKKSNLLSERQMKSVKSTNIDQRRLEFCGWCKTAQKINLQQLEQLSRLQQLERLSRMQRLEQLSRLSRMQRLEITNKSYEDYVYQEGDIVYCDPPYEGTADYGSKFDFNKFYDWVRTRPYQVWFSSYKISREFPMVYAKKIKSTLKGADGTWNYEILYTNR